MKKSFFYYFLTLSLGIVSCQSPDCSCPIVDRYQDYIIKLDNEGSFSSSEKDINLTINSFFNDIPVDVKFEGGNAKYTYDENRPFIDYSVSPETIEKYNSAVTSYCSAYPAICKDESLSSSQRREELLKLSEKLRSDLSSVEEQPADDPTTIKVTPVTPPTDPTPTPVPVPVPDLAPEEPEIVPSDSITREIVEEEEKKIETIVVIKKDATPTLEELSKNELAVLAFNFLKQYKKWSFNAPRIKNFGGKKPKYKKFKYYKSSEIEDILLLMSTQKIIKTHVYNNSNMFAYKSNQENASKFEELIK